MTIDKYTPWAAGVVGESDANGPKVEEDSTFTEEKILAGSTAERLAYPTFNRLHNRADTAIGVLCDHTPPACFDKETAIRLGVYTDADCFASGMNSQNHILAGTTSNRYHRVAATKINGVPKILAADMSSGGKELITIIDAETMTVDGTQSLSAGLPTGDWSVQGVCADETNAYICLEDASYNQIVQAYKMSDWSVADGWPSTGLDYGTGSGSLAPVTVINVDDDYIAIGANNYAAAGTTWLIGLVSKADGTLSDSGNGDSGISSGTYNIAHIATNGENIFFAANGKICSASVANLSVGCGGTGWPRTTASLENGAPVACAGSLVVLGGTGGTTSTPILHIAHESVDEQAVIIPDSDEIIDGIQAITFDGLNFWARGMLQAPGASGNYLVSAMFKIDLNRVTWSLSSGVNTLNDRIDGMVKPFAIFPEAQDNSGEGSNLVYDGRDLWFGSPGYSSGTNYRGYVSRFPLTHWR